ncbi:phosphonate metabolism protein/1,5-bisphosphokinase (PRPP-forming) PhnN [Acinetobacter pittii]|uniref:phosphonate metabolism protein/1,5-bisphosphokinase (PRPP-forming) PhnN n=1 Tax=Acinetobacter pittii TaxID=48296 RepID=UPI0021CD912C|nr:phosphonate metabolism protein/1,5-bisphosphokinase (PRPP-forming) PhnN [Acinetobacter pittii]MCU4335461.1 phosphonate metabolism protein/1,5-bisphosphokinase (PRPP-forming) PhnN [Acinetobacter pittii]
MLKAHVFYLMGPSGSGKDALIQWAKQHFAAEAKLVFAHRYITRPIDLNENHIALTETEFLTRQNAGLFALSWQSHQLHYGIGIEIDTWLAQGHHVLINGSRAHLAEAKQHYANLVPILIDVDTEILAKRLHARGRESMEQIEQRLARNAQLNALDEDIFVLHNNSTLNDAGHCLVNFLHNSMYREPQ